jgi:hypothetical protein
MILLIYVSLFRQPPLASFGFGLLSSPAPPDGSIKGSVLSSELGGEIRSLPWPSIWGTVQQAQEAMTDLPIGALYDAGNPFRFENHSQ